MDLQAHPSGMTYEPAAKSIPAASREPEPLDDYIIEPFSGADIAIHVSGALLNAAGTLPAIAFLLVHADLLLDGWPLTLIGLAVGIFVADFISGLLHWAFDTWFHEGHHAVRRMVTLVREHHIHPERIFNYGFWHDGGMLSWFAFLASAPLFALAMLPAVPPTPARYALAVAGVTISLEIVFMLEFHKCGHRVRRGRTVRVFQRMHLLLSPEHHLDHHAGRHDRNYCLITGVADRTLGRLGVFRALEQVVSALTGAVPRENDREWLQRYDRLAR